MIHDNNSEKEELPKTSPGFLRARTIGFTITALLSFVWGVLLCVDLYALWAVMDTRQRGLVIVLLTIHVLTVFALFILLLVAFKPWLDAARTAFLLMIHIGIASVFTVARPSFQCHISESDSESTDATCQLTTILIIVGSWIAPVLLLTYAFGLSYMVYQRRQRRLADPNWDNEKFKRSRASLPMMSPSEEYLHERKQEMAEPWNPRHSRRTTWNPAPTISSRTSHDTHTRTKSTSASSHHASMDYTYKPPLSPDPFRASTTLSQYQPYNPYRTPSFHATNARRDTWMPPPPDPYQTSTSPGQLYPSAGAYPSKPVPIATVW